MNLFRQLVIYLAPVLPKLAKQTGELLGEPVVGWQQSQTPLVGTPVRKFEHLMQRVDPKQVAAMVAASTESASNGKPAEAADEGRPATIPFDTDEAILAEPLAEQISFDEFAKTINA